MSEKYFLYARKSTDVEDKQVLSIEAQLAELRAYGKQEDLEIVEELVEKQSAKTPGRRIFGDMLKRIETGEASGILAWHPDRLARNSIDGGQIIYLLDMSKIQALKFPSFWFESTSQGKFMLSIAFGQSKYYVDNLAENTKRGLRQKVRRGEYPSHAPIGYINDIRNKTIVVDKRRSPIVRQAFELYAKNQSRLEDISNFLAKHKILTNGGKHFKKDRVSFMLSNPFYYGHFRYAGELYEGKHTPIILKKLFDQVQTVLTMRGKPRKHSHNQPKAYCGLLACGGCNMGITAETQKGHVYYRCTRKSKAIRCTQPFVREEELDNQLSDLLTSYSMPDSWAQDLRIMLAKDEQTEQTASGVFVADAQTKIRSLQSKLQRLLDGYLDQDIEREVYVSKKSQLMSEKKSLEEQTSKLTLASTSWLEPMKQWINEASSLCKIAKSDDLTEKKTQIRKIFGSNIILSNKRAQLRCPESKESPLEKHWTALRAALQNSSSKSESFLMAGAEGFEPPNASTKNWCLTTWPRPIVEVLLRCCHTADKTSLLGSISNFAKPSHLRIVNPLTILN